MKKKAFLTGLAAILVIALMLSCGDDGTPACVDNDGDTYGQNCSAGLDCDDANASINPGAAEVNCDDVENDCNAATLDAPPDGDGDGWDVCGAGDQVNPDGKDPGDCDDSDDSIYPGAPTICGDGVDQDCNGSAKCYAYVADGNGGLAIIDVSDPTNPGTPVYRDTSGESRGVYVTGGYAYIADNLSGLAIIDVSDPANPGTPVIYRDTDGWTVGVYVTGGYAYVADEASGIAIIDVSDPTNPGTPVYRDTTGSSEGVYVTGDYAYVADGDSGLAIIDVTDPTNPGTPVYRDTSGYSYGVYVIGD